MCIHILGIFLQCSNNIKRDLGYFIRRSLFFHDKYLMDHHPAFIYSNSVCFVSFPKKITANTPITMATQKIAKI